MHGINFWTGHCAPAPENGSSVAEVVSRRQFAFRDMIVQLRTKRLFDFVFPIPQLLPHNSVAVTCGFFELFPI